MSRLRPSTQNEIVRRPCPGYCIEGSRAAREFLKIRIWPRQSRWRGKDLKADSTFRFGIDRLHEMREPLRMLPSHR